MRGITAFDFDGTYTLHDTLPRFLKHAFGTWGYLWGLVMCLPWIALYKLGGIDGGKAKERLLGHFVKGMPRERFAQLCEAFASDEKEWLERPAARRAMDTALAAGEQVLVVTASVREWVEPWFSNRDVTVLATEMQVDGDGNLTGRFATPNCNGEEKWRRIASAVPDIDGRPLTAYGDSRGDKAMLARAHKAYLRSFDTTIEHLPFTRRHRGVLFWCVLGMLVLYQMLGVFYGMDIADAGFYLTFYDNIFTHPESVEYNFMYYLSGVIGGMFQTAFPSMGMCGMRLLGVAFNTLCAVILYLALRRKVDERALTLGCALVVGSFIAPPYTLCYDLCTIVFYMLAITLMWRGLEKDTLWLTAVAGIMAGLNILVRIPNVLGLLLALAPFIKLVECKAWGWKRAARHSAMFLVGAAVAAGAVLWLMPAAHFKALANVMNDLRAIADDDSGTASHSTGRLIAVQLQFYATGLWTAVKLAVPVAVYWLAHNKASNKPLQWLAKAAALAAFVWFTYRMNPLEPVWVMCLAGGIMVLVEHWRKPSGLAMMAVLGIGMMLVMPLGSDGAYNNGTIIAWALAPVAAQWWLSRSRAAFPLVLIAVCAVRMVTSGAYFDGGPLWQKQYTVNNDRVAHIYTTRERADAINTMLTGIAPRIKPGATLMAYGSAPLVNYLTRTRPYLGCSWVEQLSASMLEKKLDEAARQELPPVLQQKFNNIGPVWSEPTNEYLTAYNEQTAYHDSKKLTVLHNFLKRHGYRMTYQDKYFVLYQPAWND